jgi:hypothetical protein
MGDNFKQEKPEMKPLTITFKLNLNDRNKSYKDGRGTVFQAERKKNPEVEISLRNSRNREKANKARTWGTRRGPGQAGTEKGKGQIGFADHHESEGKATDRIQFEFLRDH